MALSAWIELSCSSQSIAGNYSNVYVKFVAKTTNNTHNDNNKSGYIKVNGSHYTSFTHKLPKTSTTILWAVRSRSIITVMEPVQLASLVAMRQALAAILQ